jgi:hypothetical protein
VPGVLVVTGLPIVPVGAVLAVCISWPLLTGRFESIVFSLAMSIMPASVGPIGRMMVLGMAAWKLRLVLCVHEPLLSD